MSIILRPSLPAEHISLLTLYAGVACALTVEEVAGIACHLKWPNDLYIGSAKLAGILTESGPFSFQANRFSFIVVGIGINVNCTRMDFPPLLRDQITTLHQATARDYDCDRLMASISQKLHEITDDYERLKQYVLAQWQQRDYLYGRKVTWQGVDKRTIYGSGGGLCDDGRYKIVDETGAIHLILAGELKPDHGEKPKFDCR